MSEPCLDPINLPVEWHRFLYRSVLLEWETELHQRKQFPRFNARKPVTGITFVKFEGLPELRQRYERQDVMENPTESIIFYSRNAVLRDLFKLIRNCVAHGHYSSPRKGWIYFHHMHEKKLKLFGHAKFSNFKALIAAIAPDDSHMGASSAN